MLRKYLFVNDDYLNNIFYHVPKNQIPQIKKKKKLLSIGSSGVRFDFGSESANSDINVHEKSELVIKYLMNSNLIEFERPISFEDGYNNQSKPFVLETFEATQMLFPKESLMELPGVDYFVLWISDPDPSIILNNSDRFNYIGSFLYLTQMRMDDGSYSYMRSGCSALQAVVNFLEGRPLQNTILHGGREKFGRSNFNHPVDKLISIGAKKVSTKKITALYQKRYISNEQCFIFNNKEERVGDLLGYPIFISEDF